MSADEAPTEAPPILAVEAQRDEGQSIMGYVDCLWYCLQRRGEARSEYELMGLSGESFRFFFNQQDPYLGLQVVSHNPLRAVASALGYDCDLAHHQEVAQALDALCAALRDQPGPAIVHTRDGWTVVAALRPD